jgi:signal transduction histidine kinase
VELADVIEQVVHSYRQQAEAAEVDLQVHANEGLPKVRGDAACVGVLVANLLSNAIKYNRPGGSAEIQANCGQESVELKVIDTGIGISEQNLPRLFSEFYRIKTEKTENISGTGLGLTICKAIVEELGGSIEASNNETQGSTFTVRLPTAPADNPRSTT